MWDQRKQARDEDLREREEIDALDALVSILGSKS